MTLADDVKSMYKHTKDVYDSLELLGATLPEDKNLENLASAFESVPMSGGWDPENPTLESLKYALDNDLEIPIGTEITDTYDGHDNPLIVAQRLDSTNNSSYGGAEGVILVRKYVEPTVYNFGSTNSNWVYSSSSILQYLKGDYLNNCSDELKALLAPITVKWFSNSTNTFSTVSSKWFLMSNREVNQTGSDGEGISWDYWKTATGSDFAVTGTSDGRIGYNLQGEINSYWLRSNKKTGSTMFCQYVSGNGAVLAALANAAANPGGLGGGAVGVLPACFIAKGDS